MPERWHVEKVLFLFLKPLKGEEYQKIGQVYYHRKAQKPKYFLKHDDIGYQVLINMALFFHFCLVYFFAGKDLPGIIDIRHDKRHEK